MKKYTFSILAVFLMIVSAGAQTNANATATAPADKPAYTGLSATELSTLDLSGKYTGQRHQFTPDRKSIMQSFVYEFNLVQTGNLINGTSTIIKDNGDYADIKLRGTLMGDKLYFEEYEIVNQDKDPNMVWCYKSGALNIRKDGDMLKLVGITDSYMADYYIPCTGGTTDLSKVDNSNNFKKDDNAAITTTVVDVSNMNVSPNPFVDATKINYTLASNTNVTLEVYDITGRKITVLENNIAKTGGTYSIDFSAKAYGLSAGIFIAKLSTNGKVYSSEMVLMK